MLLILTLPQLLITMLGKILFVVLGLSLLSVTFALTHEQAQAMLSGAGTYIIKTEINLNYVH